MDGIGYYYDCSRVKWTDPGGLYSENIGSCFICLLPTHRIDVGYEAYFCNSTACNARVDADLKALDKAGSKEDVSWNA